MLVWSAIFAGIALIAGIFAFGNVSSVSSPVAMIVFAVFLIASGVAVIGHLVKPRDVEGTGHVASAPWALTGVLKRVANRISTRFRR